ncbi:hypothetical protein [Naasia lichenicola]|uniref:Uncharacterized protein n=1 Tax=Naasia lichenicola TaxID=2565933 RepID=A0A4S4FHK6_9MICO|nr:hypothetical protein [Naasia lichenicola]THG28516.1 hypothetical protein E6C64_17005 [Naasia lichenicola]
MIRDFLSLKLRLLANAFKRSPWQVVGLVLAIAYGLGITILAVVTLVLLRFAEVEVARAIVVIIGSALVLGFALVPLAFGVDDTLDPRRFALFGIENTRLALYLLFAALISVPSFVIIVFGGVSVFTWARDFGSFVFGVLGAALAIATCIVVARVSTSVAAFLLATRRAREFTALLGILAFVLISPGIIVLAGVNWQRDGLSAATALADGLAWSPLGAAWSAPGDAAEGNYGLAILRILIAAASLVVLLVVWRALLGWMLVTPEREARARHYTGLGWFDRLPSGPTAAVSARSATYWLRDPRYRVSLIIIPITPLLMMIPLLVVGVPSTLLALLPVPVMSLFLGWAMHNDVAYDSTAIWMHVASGVKGRADRIGRLFPALVLGIPVVILGSFISAYFYGQWNVVGGLIGVSSALLFAGLGFSSLISARFPYPVVKPGDSPFAQPQSAGATTAAVQSIAFPAALIPAAPAIVFAWLGFFTDPRWFVASLVSGVSLGVVALVFGVAVGSWIYDRRGPELVGAATRS